MRRLIRLHENEPVGVCLAAAGGAEEGRYGSKGKDFAELDLGFVPLEDERAVGL